MDDHRANPRYPPCNRRFQSEKGLGGGFLFGTIGGKSYGGKGKNKKVFS